MRSLHPALALVAFIALPMALAEDSPTQKTGPAPSKQESVEPDRETRVLRLKYADARTIAGELTNLGLSGWTPGGSLRVIADARTNSLVLSASAATLANAEKIVQQLDIAPVSARQTQIVRLKHAPAKDLAAMLREVITQKARSEPAEWPGISFDERTSTLVLTGETTGLEALMTLVENLDVPTDESSAMKVEPATQARITVYEVAVPKELAAGLRATELARTAQDDAGLNASLSKLGKSRLLYAVDQAVNLKKQPSIRIACQMPWVTAEGSKDEKRTTNISYQDVGLIANMVGVDQPRSSKHGDAHIEVEISTVGHSDVSIGPNAKAPLCHKIRQTFDGPFTTGEPIVLLSVESAADGDMATAYVTRIELARKEPKAARS